MRVIAAASHTPRFGWVRSCMAFLLICRTYAQERVALASAKAAWVVFSMKLIA
jgi:hypothetical protein